MIRFCSIFLAFVYTLMLKIIGFVSKYSNRSKCCVVEENGLNFSANHSRKDNQVVSYNSMVFLSSGLGERESLESNKEDFSCNIAKTEDSVLLKNGLIAANTSKCQFMASKDVFRYLEEPIIEKFLVQQMFVGSDEVLVSKDEILDDDDDDDENSQKIDSLEQNLDTKVVDSDEESDSFSFCFNLFNNSYSTNEDSQGQISEMEKIGQEVFHSEEVYEEKEKLSSNESKDFRVEEIIDSVKDESFEDQDFSYEVELLPISRFSTVDANQEFRNNFLDEKEQRKTEDFEKKHDIDHNPLIIKNLFLGPERIEDLDDEYIEFEPLSDNLTRVNVKSTTSCEDAKNCSDLDYDSDDDEDENEQDALWEHQNLVQQMKLELKNCRIRGLPTISEECESPKMVEDLKPLQIDHKIGYKDVMEEIQKFYMSYLEKMRKLDILNYQTLHAISFLQLKDSEVFTAGKKKSDSVNFISPKIWPRKAQRIYADSIHKSIVEMRRDLELVYVGQLCLSWEILCWLYAKACELMNHDFDVSHSYNRATEEFQQFHVLLQRFMEDEPFHRGHRNQNYVRSRCMIRSLLQVPSIKDDCLNAKKERREETDAISLELLAEIIKESMLIFRDFLFADKKSANVVLKGIQGTQIDLQDPENSALLVDIISNLQKKERRIRDHIRSQNCIVKKLKKQHERRSDNIEVLTSQVELRLVSRVLSLSILTTDQLVWCRNKLNNINFVRRKIHVEASFLLFPC